MPSSQWLETDYVPDRLGGSGLKLVWKQNGRVQVDHRFLWPWYRTLDELDSKEGGRLKRAFLLGPKDLFFLEAQDGLLRFELFLLRRRGSGGVCRIWKQSRR
ncbi:hypothetical protein A7Q09_08270 [Methylacidiphilum sp. Yel]|nr:hypothetical protein A7Q09_08270 [Methylacidiphilum sp. Yel]